MTAVDGHSAQERSTGGAATLLSRGLGVRSIVFMVVAAVAPLGATAVVLPTVFALSGTAAAPVYFIGAAVLLCLFSVGFTLMGRHVQDAGAFYTYVQAGLGRMAGAGAAGVALVSYLALLIALFSYLGVAASAVLESYLHLSVTWWALSLVGVAIVALLGYRDVELSAKVLGVDGVLCGIRPAVAQTVVALGLELASVRTTRSLRDALKWCIRMRAAARPRNATRADGTSAANSLGAKGDVR